MYLSRSFYLTASRLVGTRKVGPIPKGVKKFADGCVKEVNHRLTGTTHTKKNNCYLPCNFDLCGKHYEKELSLAKVKAGHANLTPSTNSHYAGAAAAAAPFSIACEAGIADVDDATLTTPAPAPTQSPTVPLDITTLNNVIQTLSPVDPAMYAEGSTAATAALGLSSPLPGAQAAAAASTTTPTRFGSLASLLMPQPPASLGCHPPGSISTNTKEHSVFNEAKPKNKQKWYHPNGKPIVMDNVPTVKWSATDRFGNVYHPTCGLLAMSKLEAWMMMYGDACLNAFYNFTNIELKNKHERPFENLGEAIRFMGVMRLITPNRFV